MCHMICFRLLYWGLCTVLTPFHSTHILTSSPPSGPLSYFTVSEVKLSRLRCFSRASGSLRTSATRCLCTLSRPWWTHTHTHREQMNANTTNPIKTEAEYLYALKLGTHEQQFVQSNNIKAIRLSHLLQWACDASVPASRLNQSKLNCTSMK